MLVCFFLLVFIFVVEGGRRRKSIMKAAMCIKVVPQDGRVKTNVGHQGEELTYRVVNKLVSHNDNPTGFVWWPWDALPWSIQMLEATVPNVKLIQEKIPPSECQQKKNVIALRPIVKPPQWSSTANHAIARRRAYEYCDFPMKQKEQKKDHVRVTLLERVDDLGNNTLARKRRLAICSTTSTLQRKVAEPWRFEQIAKNAARDNGLYLDFRRRNVSSANPGDFCQQLQHFADTDVLLSIHGAHLVSVPFLPPGSLLFEVLPWAHSRKKHHNRLLLNTDISYAKLCGHRPPAGLPAQNSEAFCEGRTQQARTCATQARDCFPTFIKSMQSHPDICSFSRASIAPASSDNNNFKPCLCIEHFERRIGFFFNQLRKRRRQSLHVTEKAS